VLRGKNDPRLRYGRIGPPEDDFESDHVSWVPLAELPGLISRGEISAGTTLAALLYALTRQEPGKPDTRMGRPTR